MTELGEGLGNVLETFNDLIDKEIKKMEHGIDTLEYYRKLIDLYGDTSDYSLLNEIASAQTAAAWEMLNTR
jgi:uncharacterized protein Yka (UPF0111/DUF47 family)